MLDLHLSNLNHFGFTFVEIDPFCTYIYRPSREKLLQGFLMVLLDCGRCLEAPERKRGGDTDRDPFLGTERKREKKQRQ